MADRLPDSSMWRCPKCKRGMIRIEGPLEWCLACAYETPRSQRVPDGEAQRMAERVSDAT